MSLLAFYRNQSGGPDGHRLEDIWSWSDERLEEEHAWVSWLFPSARPSDFNRGAPILTDEVAAAFAACDELRANLARSLERFLSFLGLESGPEGAVSRASLWAERREEWLVPGDHNFRRITRVLEALTNLGLGDRARALLDFLEGLCEDEDRLVITEASLVLWRRAAGAPSRTL